MERVPFLMLALDLPPAPLFKGALEEKVTIPQVPVFDLLRKYDGATVHEDIKAGERAACVCVWKRAQVRGWKGVWSGEESAGGVVPSR